MSTCSSFIAEIPSMSKFDANINDDNNEKFREIVYDFIERIAREVSVYEDSDFILSANNFRHIELQIQAKRVENILKLCISKIQQVFYLSYLIEHQCDHLTLFLARNDADHVARFAQKWLNSVSNPKSYEFNEELKNCLNIVNEAHSKWKSPKVINKINYCYEEN